jgi:hypothetical protein
VGINREPPREGQALRKEAETAQDFATKRMLLDVAVSYENLAAAPEDEPR